MSDKRGLGALVGMFVLAVIPGLAADASNGEALARRWCISCHVVAADQKQLTTEAPPFSTVANKHDFNAGQLALFLLNPHPKMPDMNLTRNEAGDLAAYIATLRSSKR